MVEDNLFENIAELVEKFKAGDESAYEELYEKTQRMVYYTCLGILNNDDDAFDAMQDTYLTVYRRIDTLEDNKTFISWIKKVATTRSLNLYKKRKGDVSYDDTLGADESLQVDDNLESLPDYYILEKTKREALDKIIKAELTDVQYQTIHMHYYSEFSVEQIAELMECPVGTVKTRLKASRARIKEGVKKYEEENKTVLAVAPGVPFLTRFFQADANSQRVPDINVTSLLGNQASNVAPIVVDAVAQLANNDSVKDVAKGGFLSTIAGKLLVGTLAVSVPTVAGFGIYKSINKQTNETEIIQTIVETTEMTTETTTETTIEETVVEETLPVIVFDRDTLVVDNAIVSYFEEFGIDVTYHIPQITEDTEDAAEINDSIMNDYMNDIYSNVSYCVFWPNEEVVSILIDYNFEGWAGMYRSYTYNAATGHRLTNSEILDLAGIEDSTFREMAIIAVGNMLNENALVTPYVPVIVDGDVNPDWVNALDFPVHGDYDQNMVYVQMAMDAIDINTDIEMFINQDGHIMFWRKIWPVADPHASEDFFDVVTGEYYLDIRDINAYSFVY